jgi:hypothetical protein
MTPKTVNGYDLYENNTSNKTLYSYSVATAPTVPRKTGFFDPKTGCYKLDGINCVNKQDRSIMNSPGKLAGIIIGATRGLSMIMFSIIATMLIRKAKKKVAERSGNMDGGKVLRLEVGSKGEVLRKGEMNENDPLSPLSPVSPLSPRPHVVFAVGGSFEPEQEVI